MLSFLSIVRLLHGGIHPLSGGRSGGQNNRERILRTTIVFQCQAPATTLKRGRCEGFPQSNMCIPWAEVFPFFFDRIRTQISTAPVSFGLGFPSVLVGTGYGPKGGSPWCDSRRYEEGNLHRVRDLHRDSAERGGPGCGTFTGPANPRTWKG